MHEISLCEDVVQLIEAQAGVQGFRRVRTVRLEIGSLAGVEIEAMRFGFDAVARGSIADGASLEIIEVPGTAWCPHCRKQVGVELRFDACPDCGHQPLQLTAGDEMRILELEVE
ncbi:MAG TPA: hydrogenase maturation nickel metallochaperone HypA [Mariprofundaceae bacterium]|nr:hydrogenase maturation nickel metallochaperone HypA [Mariprofundaceae bacterium]